MSSKILYSAIAAIGIGAASYGAWWYMHRAQATGTEVSVGSSGQAPGGATASRAAAAGPAGSASGPGAGGGGAARPASVEVAKVERISLRDDTQAIGTLRSRQSVVLRPEISGRVAALGFEDGAPVRRGQLLVQLDDVLQRAELRQAQAQVSIAQANFKRNQELVAQNFVAQRVLDESAANLQVAEAQLALACARLERMRVVAPFDATAGIRTVNLGDYVKDGADLINLEDISSLYVDFRLPERFQSKVRVGQEVELQLDAIAGRLFRARVQAVDPLIDANGRSIGVRATLPNTPGEPLAMGGGRGGAGGGAGAGAGGPPRGPGGAGPSRGQGTGPAGGPARAGLARASEAGTSGPASAMARPSAGVAEPIAGCPTPAGRAVVVAEGPDGSAPAGSARRPGAPGGPLRPGMFARVEAVFSVRDNALAVPEEAIVPQGGRQFVIKVVPAARATGSAAAASVAAAPNDAPEASNVSQRVEVKLGIRRPGRVEITEGLNEGDVVVVAGQQRLQRDGTPLRVVELGRGGGPAGSGRGPGAPGAPGAQGPQGAAPAAASAGPPVGAGAAVPQAQASR